jgi:hypothetical protein
MLVTADMDRSCASALNLLLRGRHSPQRYSNTYILNLSFTTAMFCSCSLLHSTTQRQNNNRRASFVIFHKIALNMADYYDLLVTLFLGAVSSVVFM